MTFFLLFWAIFICFGQYIFVLFVIFGQNKKYFLLHIGGVMVKILDKVQKTKLKF
jgi:hypothetical protein